MAELNTTGRKQPTIGNKPKNFKETIKKLLIYYKNYKKMFFVALIIALIGGVASTLSIIFSGILYAQYIIPPSFTQIDPFPYGEFGLTSFIW
jgi:hypothetical protein